VRGLGWRFRSATGRDRRLPFGRCFGGRRRGINFLCFFFRDGVRHVESVKPAQFDGHVLVDGAGVRLLLADAQFRESVENLVSFDF
jgi:hypothetical protein